MDELDPHSALPAASPGLSTTETFDTQRLLFIVQLAATVYMTGVIWFVQLVHYRLYPLVGAEEFAVYEQVHRQAVPAVVAIPMLLELATSGLSATVLRPRGPAWPWVVGFMAVIGLFVSTFAIQVPAHIRLEQGYDAATALWLLWSNWVRTALWSIRSLFLLSQVQFQPDVR